MTPAVDAGIPFYGSAPDIGAYEAGTPVEIALTSIYDEMHADSTYQFEVEGTDSAGYPTPPGALIWSHSYSTGTISSTGLFTPQLVGSGRIVARTPDGKLADTTDYIEVVPGLLKYLSVTPRRETLFLDSTVQFFADGIDVKGNLVTDFGNLTWEVLNNIGSISTSGLFTASGSGMALSVPSVTLGRSTSPTLSRYCPRTCHCKSLRFRFLHAN